MTPEWIAADWGTSRLRVWAMDGNTALAASESNDGMGGLDPDGFEPALLGLIGDWLGTGKTPVVACGMVGSRQGWKEAPYAAIPCPPLAVGLTTVETRDPRLDVRIVPGLKSGDPADVMRGEETQIAGFLATEPGFSGTICLPGTHTKWVHVSAGRIDSFATTMTGELFALLESGSVLSHSMGPGWSDEAFLDALGEALSRPAALTQKLFALRASALLDGAAPDTIRSGVSGYLIGAELAAMREYWLGQRIALVGADCLVKNYATALESQGAMPEIGDGESAALSGLFLAHSQLYEVTR